MSAPRVCTFLTDNLGLGGSERAFVHIVSWLHGRRPDLKLRVVLFRAQGPFLEDLPPGIEVHQLPSAPGFFLRNAARLAGLRRLLRRDRDAIVVSFQSHVNQFLLLAGLVCPRVKAIVVEQCAYSFDPLKGAPRPVGWLKRLLAGYLYRRAGGIVAISGGLKAELEALFGLGDKAVTVIHNPVDVDALAVHRRKRARAPFVYGFLGRFVEQKNPALLVEAFSELCLGEPEGALSLRMIGYGALEESLKALALRHGVSGSIEWPGPLKTPWPVLAGCHCLVLPSRFEGFANVLVEALALGLPVIAADCPHGPREIISGTPWAGILVPGEDKEALKSAMSSLRLSYDSWALHEEARAAYARRFSVEAVGASYEALLTS